MTASIVDVNSERAESCVREVSGISGTSAKHNGAYISGNRREEQKHEKSLDAARGLLA